MLDVFMSEAKHPVKLHHVGEPAPPCRKSMRFSQNGLKFQTICADCNNRLLGSIYDRELKRVSDEMRRIVTLCHRRGLALPAQIPVSVKTHALFRGIVGHMLAAHRSPNQAKPLPGFEKGFYHDLREYFLDMRRPIPPSARLFYWTYPSDTQKSIPSLALLQASGDGVAFGDLLKFFPIAFYLVDAHMGDWEKLPGLQSVGRIQGDGCTDPECIVDVIVTTRDFLPLDWPEVPTVDHLTLLVDEVAVVAVEHRA